MTNESPKQTQCDICAFMLTEDQSTIAKTRLIESKYRTIREAINAPKKTRHLSVGGLDDRTETCVINSPMWLKRKENVHCSDRVDSGSSLETALDLREASEANKLAREANVTALSAKIWAIIAAIIATIAIAMPYLLPPPK
jgi:hypothetical protein